MEARSRLIEVLLGCYMFPADLRIFAKKMLNRIQKKGAAVSHGGSGLYSWVARSLTLAGEKLNSAQQGRPGMADRLVCGKKGLTRLVPSYSGQRIDAPKIRGFGFKTQAHLHFAAVGFSDVHNRTILFVQSASAS
jgi:hypothetical protein